MTARRIYPDKDGWPKEEGSVLAIYTYDDRVCTSSFRIDRGTGTLYRYNNRDEVFDEEYEEENCGFSMSKDTAFIFNTWEGEHTIPPIIKYNDGGDIPF